MAAGSKKGKKANFVQTPKPITTGEVEKAGGRARLGNPYTSTELAAMAPGFKPRTTASRQTLYQRPLTAADRTDVPFSGMTTNRTQEEMGLAGANNTRPRGGKLIFPGQEGHVPLIQMGTMEESLPTLKHPEGEEGDKSRAKTAAINEVLASRGTISRVARPEGGVVNRMVYSAGGVSSPIQELPKKVVTLRRFNIAPGSSLGGDVHPDDAALVQRATEIHHMTVLHGTKIDDPENHVGPRTVINGTHYHGEDSVVPTAAGITPKQGSVRADGTRVGERARNTGEIMSLLKGDAGYATTVDPVEEAQKAYRAGITVGQPDSSLLDRADRLIKRGEENDRTPVTIVNPAKPIRDVSTRGEAGRRKLIANPLSADYVAPELRPKKVKGEKTSSAPEEPLSAEDQANLDAALAKAKKTALTPAQAKKLIDARETQRKSEAAERLRQAEIKRQEKYGKK